MDPEQEMIAEARRCDDNHCAKNIEWVKGGSEDLTLVRQRKLVFKLVTMGSSFHWMNRKQVLLDLRNLIEPDGGIAVVGCNTLLDCESDWAEVVRSVVRKYLGPERKAGKEGTYSHPAKRHHEVIEESDYLTDVESHSFKRVTEIGTSDVLGFLYSTSFCSQDVLGDKRSQFERELTEALENESPSGKFREEKTYYAIFACKRN